MARITMTHPDLPDREIVARTERQAEVYAKSGWQRKEEQPASARRQARTAGVAEASKTD